MAARPSPDARGQAGLPPTDLNQDRHAADPGICPKGKRLRGKAPFGHWKTLTLIGGLRNDRMVIARVLDGPINREPVCLRYHLDNAGHASVEA